MLYNHGVVMDYRGIVMNSIANVIDCGGVALNNNGNVTYNDGIVLNNGGYFTYNGCFFIQKIRQYSIFKANNACFIQNCPT